MNIPVHEDRTTISFEPPVSKSGQYISLKAEVDLIVAFSACPQVSLSFLDPEVGVEDMKGRMLTIWMQIGYLED